MSLGSSAVSTIAFQASHYKLCLGKEYVAYVCRPALGTFVVNHLEQSRVVARLGTSHISTGQLQLLCQTGNPLYTELSRYCANHQAAFTSVQRPLVLAGTMGEMTVASVEYVQRQFKCDLPLNKPLFGWHRVLARPQRIPNAAGCFIPVKYQGTIDSDSGIRYDVNNPDVSHGKGDFVCCAVNMLGQPNFSTMKVINGLAFGNMVNNKGFIDCLSPEVSGISMTDLPNLLNVGEVQTFLRCVPSFRY